MQPSQKPSFCQTKSGRKRAGAPAAGNAKVFWSFFSKKDCLLALLLILAGKSAQATDLRVCVDTSSATAARDKTVAEKVAQQAGLTLVVSPFDGSGDSDGFPLRKFKQLLARNCDLVMGYPVDTTDGAPPEGLLATKPYAQTGFVLVDAPGTTARSLAELPAGTEVAITAQTAPALYFADNKNILADMLDTDADTLRAIVKGDVKAAMLWQPTVEQYESQAGAVKFASFPLGEPHARYNVVALYLPAAAPKAQIFNATKIALKGAAPDTGASPPALFTKAQAAMGLGKFVGNCAMCHGGHLEGRSGPALRGPNWANAKADYTLGEVFSVVSQQMPATNPGSLEKAEYVEIMAYLLQQNGYPAGNTALDYDQAVASKVPLRWQGGS